MNTCSPFAKATLVLSLVFLMGSITAKAGTVTNFVDEFNGPTLDSGWSLLTNGATVVGFINLPPQGYQFTYPSQPIGDSGLIRDLDGSLTNDIPVSNSFTVDATVKLDNLSSQTGQFKLRFFGGQFMEVVYEIAGDDLRVYSAEVGGNLVFVNDIGLPAAGGVLNLRVNRDVDTGTVVIGYSLGSGTPLQVLASTSGLVNFTPYNCDMVMSRPSGFPLFTPSMLIDRFEQRDGVFGVSIDAFTDTFDGPTLDPSWDLIQSAPGDHVGFIGGGLYEVKKTNTTGEAGLSRDFGGQDTFSSTFRFQVQDFIGSASQVEFRNPTTSGGITVTLDSTGDIAVSADGSTVTELTDYEYQDGETLEIQISEDVLTGDAQVGLSRNGGAQLRIANLTGLSDFPTNNQIVVIKNAVGNGNSPRLLLDEYSIAEGLDPIPAAAHIDDFSGPTVDSDWFVSDTGVGSHVGFNGMGQYEISPQGVGVQAGLRRFLGLAGDGATLDVRARLNDFAGSDSECRLEIPGPIGASVIIKSDGNIEVFTAVSSTTILNTPSGISDGDLFDLRLSLEFNPTNLYEMGLGINGAPLTFMVDDFDLADLDAVQVEISITKNGVGNGNNPVLVLDRFASSEGFNFIPDVPDAYSDDFSGPVLDIGWNPSGQSHLGFTNSAQYVIQVDTNADVILSRFFVNPVSGFPVGSFTAALDVQFLDLASTNTPGGGTDFKFNAEGGNLMQIVFNSFKTVRFYTANNGQSWFSDTLSDFNDGDTVNFLMAYDSSVPSVTMSVGLNGGPPVFKETRSGLVGVAPQVLEVRGFRFNFTNPGLKPRFLLDQLDINPGLGALPGTLTIERAYGGRIQIGWDSGTLQSATVIDGVYTNVPLATSPYLQFPDQAEEYFGTIGD